MSGMRIYSSMQEGMDYAPKRSSALTRAIMETQMKLRHLRQTIANRHRQKAVYARMITYYRRKIRIKIKYRDKLEEKLASYNGPFKQLLRKQREKIKLEMEKKRSQLQYLKKMSEAIKSAVKVYKKERRAYKRKFKALKVLHLTKNRALKRLKRRMRTTKEKYEDVIEVIKDLKKKLKLVKERRKSLSLKDLKKQIQLNKEKLEALQKKQTEQEPLIYQVLTDTKMMGFQRKRTDVPTSSSQLDSYDIPKKSNSQLDSYDIPKKSKSQTKRTRRLRKGMSGSFSTDTSMSKTSALKAAIRQSERIVTNRDTILEPIPIGDKLQDKTKRLANRFTKRLADRTKKSKHSSSPPGDYKTPTTISADSDDTGLELKVKKKRVTLNIGDEPLIVSKREPLSFQEANASQEEISDEESQWLKTVYDDKYFDKLAGRHGKRIRNQLHEARLKKKLELERKLLDDEEEKEKRMKEFANRKDLRASSIDSTKLNHEVRMAMKSNYRMTDVIPHNIQIIDEHILQLAGRHNRQTLQAVLRETQRESEHNRALEHLKSMKAVGPIRRKSKLLKRRASAKAQIKAEERDPDEQVAEEQVPKEKISKKKIRKKKVTKKKAKTVSSDIVTGDTMVDDSKYDDLFHEDFMERRWRKSIRTSGKKIEGLAYNNNSMYHKFIVLKKNKLPEHEHGSIRSIESIDERGSSAEGSKQKTRESLEFRKDVPEIPKQQQETQPAPVEAPKNRKYRTRTKRKSRVSIKTVTSASKRERINVIAPQQKDGSIRRAKEKAGESLKIQSSREKPKHVSSKTGAILKHPLHSSSHSKPNIQVQVEPRKEELPSTVDEHSNAVHKDKVEYDENYFQRLFRAHSAVIKRKLHQERMKKIELQKKMQVQEEVVRDSLEKPRKSMISERTSSFDSVAIMKSAIASNYRMPDVIPQDIPIVDEHILELAGKTRRQTLKDVLSENYGRTYSEEYPVHKRSVQFQRKSKLFKKKRSKKSQIKKRTESESEASEQIIKVINLQADSISQPDDKFSKDSTYDELPDDKFSKDSTYDESSNEESEAHILSDKKVEGLAYEHNSMYHKYVHEKRRRSLEEKRASHAIEETPHSTKARRSIRRKTFEIVPHKRRSRRSIKRRPKKFIVFKTAPIALKEISQRQNQIPFQPALQELYQTQSYSPVKSDVRKAHSEPKLEISNKIGEISKSLPDVCHRPPEVQVVCSACGMTNLTPGGPCCPLKPKTK